MTGTEIKRLAAMLKEELRHEMDELMSMRQAANYLGCSVQALRKRCERGGPPYHKKDGVTVFSRRELNEYYLKD